MPIHIRVPTLPESVANATVNVWHKRAGEAVRREENLADLETDKVVLEVPSPVDGILTRIEKDTGAVVNAGDVLAIIEDAQTTSATATPESPRVSMPPASPSVRRLLKARGLDTAAIKGSGHGGRVTRDDVMALEASAQKPTEEAPEVQAESEGDRPERRVAMTRIRARIAERLVEAQHTAAILTTFNEVNLAPVQELRTRHREAFLREHGIKLGLMSFFVKAAVQSLKAFPIVNASVDGADILYHGFYDVGIAVSTDRGLVVPVLRDADRMTFAEIEKSIADFSARAREGHLSLDELTGGTFSITNGGIFGSLLSTPILNPPQSAILGMHAIQERPVAENGQVVIRPMMYLALSYDHRIVDGREAVQCLVAIKQALEEPERLLIEV